MKKLIMLLLLLSANCYATEWECVSRSLGCSLYRMQTPHGWLVQKTGTYEGSITYVPDEKHEWKV